MIYSDRNAGTTTIHFGKKKNPCSHPISFEFNFIQMKTDRKKNNKENDGTTTTTKI